jgi:hypothetical protein
MSRQAIAAALAREDLASGERLVAFSLASVASRDARAWPGAPAGAARAGLSRSRYLHDRDRLVRHGLIVVEEAASGRGRSSTVALRFAEEGPWWGGRDQRRTVRGGSVSHAYARSGAAAAGGDGRTHRRRRRLGRRVER